MASWTERDGKYCTRRKMLKARLIFVLEVADEAAFAFEAKSAIAAEALVPVGNSILLATDIESGDAPALCERSVA